ncbi:uncharacterized protein CDAR_124211 [Caerostris darwini]|uniref:Uncharacterized protein n=1 Tax=Caerostris darwini TaxID=1538125 RepID=A0AAV4R728_9ARAC|nr:uncharacterized protein CDAR_124211 [Caerostris darwini]
MAPESLYIMVVSSSFTQFDFRFDASSLFMAKTGKLAVSVLQAAVFVALFSMHDLNSPKQCDYSSFVSDVILESCVKRKLASKLNSKDIVRGSISHFAEYTDIWTKCAEIAHGSSCNGSKYHTPEVLELKVHIINTWNELDELLDHARDPNNPNEELCINNIKQSVRTCLPIIKAYYFGYGEGDVRVIQLFMDCLSSDIKLCDKSVKSVLLEIMEKNILGKVHLSGDNLEYLKQCIEVLNKESLNKCSPGILSFLMDVSSGKLISNIGEINLSNGSCFLEALGTCDADSLKVIFKIVEIFLNTSLHILNDLSFRQIQAEHFILMPDDRGDIEHCLEISSQPDIDACVPGLFDLLNSIVRGDPRSMAVLRSLDQKRACLGIAFHGCPGSSRYIMRKIVHALYGLNLDIPFDRNSILSRPGLPKFKYESHIIEILFPYYNIPANVAKAIRNCLQKTVCRLEICCKQLADVMVNILLNKSLQFPIMQNSECSEEGHSYTARLLYSVKLAYNKLEILGITHLPVKPPYNLPAGLLKNIYSCLKIVDPTTLENCCPGILEVIHAYSMEQPIPFKFVTPRTCKYECVLYATSVCDIKSASYIQSFIAFTIKMYENIPSTFSLVLQSKDNLGIMLLNRRISLPQNYREIATVCLRQISADLNLCCPPLCRAISDALNNKTVRCSKEEMKTCRPSCYKTELKQCPAESRDTTLGLIIGLIHFQEISASIQDCFRSISTEFNRCCYGMIDIIIHTFLGKDHCKVSERFEKMCNISCVLKALKECKAIAADMVQRVMKYIFEYEPYCNAEATDEAKYIMPLKAKKNIGYLKEKGITYSSVGTERTESVDEPENTKILDSTKSTETFDETESVGERTSFKSVDETKSTESLDESKSTESLESKSTESLEESKSTESLDESKSTESLDESKSTESLDESKSTETLDETNSTERLDESSEVTESLEESESTKIQDDLKNDLKNTEFLNGQEIAESTGVHKRTQGFESLISVTEKTKNFDENQSAENLAQTESLKIPSKVVTEISAGTDISEISTEASEIREEAGGIQNKNFFRLYRDKGEKEDAANFNKKDNYEINYNTHKLNASRVTNERRKDRIANIVKNVKTRNDEDLKEKDGVEDFHSVDNGGYKKTESVFIFNTYSNSETPKLSNGFRDFAVKKEADSSRENGNIENSYRKIDIGSINETSGIIFTSMPTRVYDEYEFDTLYETGDSKSFFKLSEVSEISKSILHKSNNEKYTISDNTNYFKVSNSVTTESIHDPKIVEEFKIIDDAEDRHSKHSFEELRKADKNQNLNRKIDDELKMRYENMHIQNKNNEHKNKDIEENAFHITIDNDMESVITEEIDKITNTVTKPIHVVDKYITKRDKNFNSIDKTTRINMGDIMQSELIRPELVAMKENTNINKSFAIKSLAADNRGDNFEIKNTQTEIKRISDDKRIVNANTMSDVEINIGTPNIDENSKVNTKEKTYYVYVQDDDEEITTNIEDSYMGNKAKKKVVDLKENRYRIRREHIHSDDGINITETIDSKFPSTIAENKYTIDADNPKLHVDHEINFDIDLRYENILEIPPYNFLQHGENKDKKHADFDNETSLDDIQNNADSYDINFSSRFERDLEYILLNNKRFEEINRRPDFEFPPLIYEDTFGNKVVYRDFDSTLTDESESDVIRCAKKMSPILSKCCLPLLAALFAVLNQEERSLDEPNVKRCNHFCHESALARCSSKSANLTSLVIKNIKTYPLLGADEFGEICNRTVTVALNGCCELYVLKVFQQQYDYEENVFKEPKCARICQKNIFRMCFHFKPLRGYFDSLLKSYFSNLAIGSSSILSPQSLPPVPLNTKNSTRYRSLNPNAKPTFQIDRSYFDMTACQVTEQF